MVPPALTPTSPPRADSLRHALRTWIAGILTAFLALAGPGLLVMLGTIRWTDVYWTAVGTLAFGAFITATISYAMHRVVPPQ